MADEEFQVIDNPDDPQLADTPLNPPDASSGFDPQAFIKRKDIATDTTDETDPYKKALIQKITSGATDYTYGPGSPGATPADMRQKVGSHDNPLQTGDIALPQKDYELFTPEERKKLGIADTSWIKEGQPTPRGSVERYFGPDAAGFDPQRFIKRQDLKAPDATVPDIHGFMEPAPADTGEAGGTEEPTPAERIGGAISRAASKYGEALSNRRIPQFTTPQFQTTPIPQAAPQMQVIPSQGMIGAAIPSALPAPPPQAATPLAPIVGGLMDTVRGAVLPFGTKVEDPSAQYPPPGMANALTRMFPEQGQAILNNIATIRANPTSREAYNAYGQLAMTIGPFAARGLTEVAGGVKGVPAAGPEVPVPEALQPKGGTQPQGLPFKPASVQGLKNPPRTIQQMNQQVAALKYQGKHAEAKALQGQINQMQGLTVGPNTGQPTTPPGQPPQQPSGGGVPPQVEGVNPVPGSGKFKRSYRVDKSMGDQMEGIGAALESGYLRAELQSRNMLHELSKQQEADLGTLLVSDRLKTVNPNHPQIIFDSVARGIESDPAIAKALDYYKKEVKPEIEALRKRAGLSAQAAAGKQAGFISLIVKNPEPLTPTQGGIMRPGNLGRTTRFARLAEGQAKEYSTNLRDILAESYSEALKKARVREFYDSTIKKGITENGTYEELPPQLQHDLTAATQPELNQMPIQSNPNFGLASKLGDLLRTAGKGYQRFVTGMALTANPAELMNHMRRQLNLVAAKPPVGMGVMARMEALLPYFGPKLGAFKRVVSDNMSTPQNQAILKDIFDAGGGSSRSFGERYESHIPGLRQIQKGTQKLLFGIPRGRGVTGWDLRMRVQLEKMRRSVEGNVDPQRIREFANQIGQYGSQTNWFIRGLRTINPYAATSVPMRITELKTLFGEAGFKGEPLPKKALHVAETIMRGTGGTLLAMAASNYLLSGKWPWQNDKGHEFDINMGVKDKKGKTIYLKTRAFAPEFSRPISTLSVPDALRERKARHPQYLAAGMTGPANQALSLVSGPGLNLALTAATGKVPYLLKRPGEGVEFMDVAKLKKGEAAKGVSRGGRQLLMALSSINPAGERLASQHEEAAPGALGYIEEPIPGVRPFGDIFSTSYESRGGGGYSRSTGSGRGGGGRGSGGRGSGGRGSGGR